MIFSEADLTAILVTLKLATTTTMVLLLLGTPLAWWLARSQWKARYVIEAVVALPLVLPPTVLGFYLLVALGQNGPFAGILEWMGAGSLAFTFTGLVIGSIIYSLPFVVQPLQSAFIAVGRRPLEVAATLRATPLDRFFTVALPMAWPGYLTATVLGFAHTVGEFGVVLMIGGNIPGVTQVASIAIYDHVEALEYGNAHRLAGAMLLFSFLVLTVVYALNRRYSIGRL